MIRRIVLNSEKKFTAVVFDMDGVIFDTERVCLDAWKKLAEREGIEGIEEVCLKCIGTNTAETERIVREAYGDSIDYDRLKNELDLTIGKILKDDGMPIKSDVFEILTVLKNKGVSLAVASSTKKNIVCNELESAGLLDFFDKIVGGDCVSKSKPEPDIYLEACRQLGASPEKAAAVEDSFNGIRSAKAAGMTTVMVPDIKQPDDEIMKAVDFLCADLHEAAEVLANLI